MVLFKENLSCLSKEDLIKMVLDLQRDSLTGVYKREVLESLKREYYIVCLIDINGLKMINDVLGHDAGDKYIVEMVHLIEHMIKKDDILVRYGGDEFLVIFNEIDSDDIKRIKDELGKSASCGFAINKNLKEAITLADKDMYGNKNNFYINEG